MELMIKRTLFKELKSHLEKKEIAFIIGPRQAGKTTLMHLLGDWLVKKGEKTLFLNLDSEADRQFFTSQANLVKKIELEIGKSRGFVFIDEIQRLPNAGLFLKGIYDLNLLYKFIVSGSGSVELKEKIHESLVGRKRVFELSTLSFEEFVNFKTDYRYEDRLGEFFSLDKTKTGEFLTEYLNFGGYPRVVLEETLEEKRRIIDEIYQSYLEKDITYLLRVQKTEAFSNLVRLMAAQVGNLVNFSELSSTLGISSKTVKDYLWYLKKTYVLEQVTPYFKNLRKEISKSPLFYFYDLGLRNYALGIFGEVKTPAEMGFLFQNFVFNILKQKIGGSSASLHFWRTKDGAEVDFIIDKTREQIPVEAKYKEFKKPEVNRSLKSFITKYQPSTAIVVNLELEKSFVLGKTRVYFAPFFKLLKVVYC